MLSIAALIRNLSFDGLLYFANHIVTRVPSHTVRLLFYRRCLKCVIDKRSFVFMGAWFDSKGSFRMGRSSVINQRCRLDNRGGISIGDNVSISAEVCILTADHDVQSRDFRGRVRPVVIEDYAFIGTRAMILPGVTVGRGAVIAAGSVVTRGVPAFAIVAGVPAKQIGTRTDDLAYEIDYGRLFW